MNNKKSKSRKQSMKYWLVELTLTSSQVLTFYVKAINKHEAYKKADEYAILAENVELRKNMETFKLLP
ncbi:MAG: hypothetical protein DRI95_08300 [Bacteroidetes bacterium]|nr:MAG: hypothetical protein DRI95_08300 [Bacteroidota bacterium]